jgi:membrane protein DedA with SNARE-associated domain
VGSVISGLIQLRGWAAYGVIAALVFGETAVFLGFVLPGEAAVVLGGVLASRGHLSLGTLSGVVVAAAIAGPFVGYEIGKRMGDRLFATKTLQRVPGGTDRAVAALRSRGGLAVLAGRFVAIVRALMPAAAGAARVRYRTFAFFNVAGGIIWGVGYCLLGYLAGSAYQVVERRIGAGLAVAVAAGLLAAAAVWVVRRHRRLARTVAGGLGAAAAVAVPLSPDVGSVLPGGPAEPEAAGAGPAG